MLRRTGVKNARYEKALLRIKALLHGVGSQTIGTDGVYVPDAGNVSGNEPDNEYHAGNVPGHG